MNDPPSDFSDDLRRLPFKITMPGSTSAILFSQKKRDMSAGPESLAAPSLTPVVAEAAIPAKDEEINLQEEADKLEVDIPETIELVDRFTIGPQCHCLGVRTRTGC